MQYIRWKRGGKSTVAPVSNVCLFSLRAPSPESGKLEASSFILVGWVQQMM